MIHINRSGLCAALCYSTLIDLDPVLYKLWLFSICYIILRHPCWCRLQSRPYVYLHALLTFLCTHMLDTHCTHFLGKSIGWWEIPPACCTLQDSLKFLHFEAISRAFVATGESAQIGFTLAIQRLKIGTRPILRALLLEQSLQGVIASMFKDISEYVQYS